MTDPRDPFDPPPLARPDRLAEVALPAGYASRSAAATDFATTGAARQVEAAERDADPREGTWVWTVYALILFAIPTLGVSAAIGLYGVLTRGAPSDRVLASHARFQKRTLIHAAVAGAIGVVLIAVSVGVIVLFLAALWTLARGAHGLLRLRRDLPIARPDTWML